MDKWIYHPENQFHMWETAHLAAIGATIACIAALFIFQKKLIPYRKHIRLAVGWTLLTSHISLEFWYIYTGEWYVESSLPLELSSIATIVCAIMLLSKSKFLFEILYFIAIGSAIQAILTPVLHFGFPQYRYIQFFLDHILVLLSPLILIALYKFSITFGSLIKSFIALNMTAVVVFVLNIILGANYMFLRYKPTTTSILDFLGPYPLYIVALEVVAFITFVLMYIPFLFIKNNMEKGNSI